MIHVASRRRRPIEVAVAVTVAVAVLTLPRRAQIYAAVLSTPVAMCSSGAMCGAKMWR